jgi:thymidine phosphorylase
MDAPLGHAVGNALEVLEAIETLRGVGPDDVRTLSLQLAERLLRLGGLAASDAEAAARVRHALDSGEALTRFQTMIAAQGGDPAVADDPHRLPRAPRVTVVTAAYPGIVAAVHARAVGEAAAVLGAGRRLATDPVDPAAGIRLRVKPGDAVASGDPLAELHGRDADALRAAADRLEAAIHIADRAPVPTPLLIARIDRTAARAR